MLWLDDRIGARDLQQPLERLGVPVESVRLDYGDCAWLGHGEHGPDSVQIGCELKTITDLLDVDRFTGHQVPGLLRQYDRVWVIVEGRWRPGDDGVLEVNGQGDWSPLRRGRRGYTYREVDHLLATLELRAGLYVRRSGSRVETAHILASLYTWWRAKAWDEHRAHLRLARSFDVALLTPPPLRRRVASELPGVGYAKSAAVAAHFRSTRDLAVASRSDWESIDGIGRTLATRITEALAAE
jgi:ERCC4-type nuclease